MSERVSERVIASAGPLTVERFAGGAEEWDAFIEGLPGWTHFHRYGWKRVIESVFGHECI